MGWKGTIRTIGAAARRSAREADRRERERLKLERELEKIEASQQAAREVLEYETSVQELITVHQVCMEAMNWKEILETPPPSKPIFSDKSETKAKTVQKSYKPGFIDSVFKREKKQRKKLAEAVEQAKKSDTKSYQRLISQWENDLAEHKRLQTIAEKLLAEDYSTKLEVIEEFDPFSSIKLLGTDVAFSISDCGILHVTIDTHGEKIVPNEAKALLKSGKLSIKKLPKSKYYSLVQDYVCSCLLRVARECFALLPDDKVIVTARDEVLNTATGHLESRPILSVVFVRGTMEKLNFERLDPSDSLSNFVTNMSFKTTRGFSPVDVVAMQK